jgi:hypothetical protein
MYVSEDLFLKVFFLSLNHCVSYSVQWQEENAMILLILLTLSIYIKLCCCLVEEPDPLTCSRTIFLLYRVTKNQPVLDVRVSTVKDTA